MHVRTGRYQMASFRVEAVLRERPELWGILGKKMISKLCHAGVKRIDHSVLMERGYNEPHFIVSHDGLLLARVETNTLREIFPILFKQSETVLDAVRRVGAENVAYIAQYDHGCDDVAPCALYIHKTPREQTLGALIKSLSDEAQKAMAA